ncbi:MAG: hypothetical protein IK066_00480 [Kiritimatiellae bacterium]|nr:hypothetical protein [Kiritimatiellia bacterium]
MTETTEPTTPTPARRRTAALWIGAACVAAIAYLLARTAWSLLIVLLFPPDGESLELWYALISFSWLAGLLGGWWAVAKWAGTMGLCSSLSGWRRRGMELAVVVGVVAALYFCTMALGMLTEARMRATAWNPREMPSDYFVDPETGEPLVAHTETIHVRAGFDLPCGDAELARKAWQLAGDDATDAPESPENPDCPEPEGAPEAE